MNTKTMNQRFKTVRTALAALVGLAAVHLVAGEMPADYQRLSFIRGQGAQYIQTGFRPDPTDVVTFTIRMTKLDSTQAIYCGRDSDGNNTFTAFYYYNQNAGVLGCLRFDYGKVSYTPPDYYNGLDNTMLHTVTFNFQGGGGGVIVDGGEPMPYHPPKEPLTSGGVGSDWTIFASNKGGGKGTLGNYGTYELYGLTVTDQSGAVKRNYVPAKRLSNNAVGLYETEVEGFLENRGTGVFEEGYIPYVDDRIFVAPGAFGLGTSWDDAASLSTALAQHLTVPGEIWMRTGEYALSPTAVHVVESQFPLTIRGGFVGTETSADERPASGQTILTGGGKINFAKNCLTDRLTFTNMAVEVSGGATVSNVVVNGGVGVGFDARAAVLSGGQLVDSVVENFDCIGVLFSANTTSIVERCVVRNGFTSEGVNRDTCFAAVSQGLNSTAILQDCVISNNESRCGYGGGAFAGPGENAQSNHRALLVRCAVVGNRGRMGVLRIARYMDKSAEAHLYATNCLFAGNQSIAIDEVSPASSTFYGAADFVNCTIVSNVTGEAAVLFNKAKAKECKLLNTIISGNTTVGTYDAGFAPSATYSMFPEAGGTPASSKNVTGPAEFRERDSVPYYLRRQSPGADAGDASIWSAADVDLRGKPRTHAVNGGQAVDMGCYQWYSLGMMILLF